MKIFEIKNVEKDNEKHKIFYFLGIQLFKKTQKEFKRKYYILGIHVYKEIKKDFKIKKYCFGIKFCTKKDYDELCAYISQIKTLVEDVKYNIPVCIQAPFVHSYFKKYKNSLGGGARCCFSCLRAEC